MTVAVISAAAGANAGTSPPAPQVASKSTDTRGSVTFGTGTTPAAGAQLVLTFSGSWTGYSAGTPVPFVQPLNAATAALGPWYATIDALNRTLTIGCNAAPTASQGNTTYAVAYKVEG